MLYGVFLSACDFNAPLRNKVVEYYSDDDNYVRLTGIVVSKTDDWILEINILTEEHNIPYTNNGASMFGI